jgi:membrane protein YdbS with pleckstrin-like domain
MKEIEIEFKINRDAAGRYFLTTLLLQCCGFTILLFPVVFIVSIEITGSQFDPLLPLLLTCMVYGAGFFGLFMFCSWLCPQQATNLRYRLDGSTLRADGGVFFLFRKSIPLERITDVNLVQGPILRDCDIWAMRIQTAGSAQCEAILYGVREPDKIRELILAQRKSVYGEKTEDA